MKLDKYTFKELIELEAEYAEKKKYKQCEAIRWEITHRMAEKRKATGDVSWLMSAGYTGRNKNK